MAWPNLASSLSSLPLVLAGPILRRVTDSSVTVWVALKEHAKVTLNVYGDDQKTLLKSADRETTALSQYVHMVAVTARLPADSLMAGEIHAYDLSFSGDFGTKTLAQATNNASLTYSTFDKPTFVLPAEKRGDLRIMHGSCRKPHGDSRPSHALVPPAPDALAILDQLISDAATSKSARPQQLVLSGDQIYADDVADVLLILILDAANALFPGWSDPELPGAGVRGDYISKAKLTTDDTRSHLIAFPEFIMMYLFVWSDVLWSTPPTLADAMSQFGDVGEYGGAEVGGYSGSIFNSDDDKDRYDNQRDAVVAFQGTVATVRRILANIPTYMICDDHEVTDDWNMTRAFADGVYGTANGVDLIKNGLVAYALCQGWGNTPEQFEDGSPNPAGYHLLSLLDNGDAKQYAENAFSIARLVGVHTKDQLAAHANDANSSGAYEVFHDLGNTVMVNGVECPIKSLDYHYTVENKAHQIIVTDTRTWRSFPGGDDDAPILLPDDVLMRQVGTTPEARGRILMVVVTTNMPPIAGVRKVEDSWFFREIAGIYGSDLWDSWEFPSMPFYRMASLLAGKLPDTDGTRTGPVIVLSGDVHFGFASRLLLTATKTQAVFAQLVASALKNQSDKTLHLQKGGYEGSPHAGLKGWVERRFSPDWVTEQYVGWDVAQEKEIGYKSVVVSTGLDVVSGQQTIRVSPSSPTVAVDDDLYLDQAPDYHYRIDFLAAASGGDYVPTPPKIDGTSTSQFEELTRWVKAATAYRNYVSTKGKGQEIVGVNNLGEITFDSAGTLVAHTLRWNEVTEIGWVTYRVSIDPADTSFAIKKAHGE